MKLKFTLPLAVVMFLVLLIADPVQTRAQATVGSFPVGERGISFTDNGLQTPTVDAKVWYPATTAGTSTPVAAGAFPTIALGHGFNLSYLDYREICSHLASWGYIVVSPDVQNGFNVSHLEFAKELAACLSHFQSEGANNASDFFQHVDTMTGVCGHSMGGGASCLLPGVYPQIDAVSGFAPAETNPSAIAALPAYNGPYQVISGSEDNVAPENTNQTPMYNAAPGVKQWLSITGGAHCKFTDGSTICDFVSGAGSVTRPFQIYLTKKYVTAFFNHALKGDTDALSFLCGDSLQADVTRGYVSTQTTFVCTVATTPSFSDGHCWNVSPNPFGGRVHVQGTGAFEIYNALGGLVFQGKSDEAATEIDLSGLPRGVY
ncbi:MAG TPA: dienelactone hydrolase family protein, partial [Bacteroidia bacterium]|nr:dienelactone hydrolase family protein [Bacteroidia bacterium]